MILWKVKAEGRSCLFETLSEAWEDFKSHDNKRRIYPIFMSKKKFNNLPEFTGW